MGYRITTLLLMLHCLLGTGTATLTCYYCDGVWGDGGCGETNYDGTTMSTPVGDTTVVGCSTIIYDEGGVSRAFESNYNPGYPNEHCKYEMWPLGWGMRCWCPDEK
ncbi:unnamed protein product, partial [Meganyctiphanes norvegica]